MSGRTRARIEPIRSLLRAIPHRSYLFGLGALFGAIWIGLGLVPRDRAVWLLENVPVVLIAIVIAACHRRLPLSRISYTLVFSFLCLHEVGAHYTYGHVPYDRWSEALLGVRLDALFDWERNHYDRFLHFLYGLSMAYPIREVFLRVANVRGFWGYFLPLDLTMSTSMLYELIEWLVAVLGGAGPAYLATQGDPWDAHKDMALASFGALLAMSFTALINRWLQRDFAREWVESLRVKSTRPLGEDEAVRMARK